MKSHYTQFLFISNSIISCLVCYFLAAGTAKQIYLSILLFSFLFSNLYQTCQNWVSFGTLDFKGTSRFGALYALSTLPFLALCPMVSYAPWNPLGTFALLGPLSFETFYFLGTFGFFYYCRQVGLNGYQSCLLLILRTLAALVLSQSEVI